MKNIAKNKSQEANHNSSSDAATLEGLIISKFPSAAKNYFSRSSDILTSMAAAALLVVSVGCQKPHAPKLNSADLRTHAADQSGIINGDVVADADPIAKTTVGILDLKQGSLCTGSIIADDMVMTAAHCLGSGKLLLVFMPDLGKVFSALSGDNQAQVNAVRPFLRAASASAMHPNYLKLNADIKALQDRIEAGEMVTSEEITAVVGRADHGDMLVLKFTGGLPAGYAPAEVLNRYHEFRMGDEVVLAGFGINNGVTHENDNLLHKTKVSIESPNFGQFEVLLDQRKGTGACHGDSGGPAFATVNGKQLLFGVTSRGYLDEKDDCSQFSVYSNFVAAKDWLDSAMAELALPAQTAPIAAVGEPAASSKASTQVIAEAMVDATSLEVFLNHNSAIQSALLTGKAKAKSQGRVYRLSLDKLGVLGL